MKFSIRDLFRKLANELRKLKSPWPTILRVYPSPG